MELSSTQYQPQAQSPAGAVATEADNNPPRGNPFPIVGIGASAGGLEAMTDLLKALVPDTGMAFVFVQHLDPKHKSQLVELLSQVSPIPVVKVTDRVKLEPDHLYIIPPNRSMMLLDGHLSLEDREAGLHLPIDIFFRSLAAVQGSRAIGVVLSGTASDGSAGVVAIKGECGITFAQEENTARFTGMPRSAIATGAIDFVLSAADIAKELVHVARHPYLIARRGGEEGRETLPEGETELRKIFSLLHSVTKVDFTNYKRNTIRRRIGRRMMVHKITTLADYARLLEERRDESRELYRDLLISVTSFFREPEMFNRLTGILEKELTTRPKDQGIRVWVPGCATGEEVYSLAMLLHELMGSLQCTGALQIFGTDISDLALERARAATYSPVVTHDVPPDRLAKFFVKVDRGYQVSKIIRESCIFARHDVTRDPPFSHLDLVSCRNLLIYLDTKLQNYILPVFHYSLDSGGLLVLGSAETNTAAPDLFSVLDGPNRIFGRKDVPVRFRANLPPALESSDPRQQPGKPGESDRTVLRKVDQIIQSKYAPDAVVVDSALRVLQFRGRTSFYLEATQGEAGLHLLRVARESLLLPLRRLIHGAMQGGVSVRETDISIEHQGEKRQICIDVTPVSAETGKDTCYLIVFEESSARAPRTPLFDARGSGDPDAEGEIVRLEREMSEAGIRLRNITEDYEVHSEELRAANEEIRSANEELQSTNEELSTTKEELQSSNEELTTVNEELQTRNSELSFANSDLKNLLSAVKIPILMVDCDLQVRRFTLAAEPLLDLSSADLGRPLRHLRGQIHVPDLEMLTRRVIETLVTHQEEIADKNGCWFAMSVRPYRTLDNKIDGAVITFMDIDPIKRSLQAAEEARDYAEGMIETVREPLLVLDTDLRVLRATSSFYESFQVSREETHGRLLYDLGNGQWNIPRLRELLGDTLFQAKSFQDFEVDHVFPHIGPRTMRLNARRILGENSARRILLLAIEDVTERREVAELRYRRLFETAKDGVLVIDAETGEIADINPFLLELMGHARDEAIGRQIREVRAFASSSELLSLLDDLKTSTVIRHENIPISVNRGSRIFVDVLANRYLVGGRLVIQANVRDITERKLAERALGQSEERFRLLVDSLEDYALFQLDLEGRVMSWNSGAERLLLYRSEEILGKPVSILFTPEDVAVGAHEAEIAKAQAEGRSADERWQLRSDGSLFLASGMLTQLQDEAGEKIGYAKVMRDVTAQILAQEELQSSLREKEVLLKEVHHRVKNNLQVITSLLNLQSDHVLDAGGSQAFHEMRSRVLSIAAIHELLYQSANLSQIDFGLYVRKLVRDLVRLHGVDERRIHVNIDAPPLQVEVREAVPMGLLVNELLTNSLRHAFPPGRAGAVAVTLRLSDEMCELEVSDDGVGLPESLDPSASGTMGLQLVYLLADQLQGEVTWDSPNRTAPEGSGAMFRITFPSGSLSPQLTEKVR